MSSLLKPALFLDRDGTINVDVSYLSNPDDLVLLPGAGEALRQLQESFELVVITNQSAIARGIMAEDRLEIIHGRLDSLLAEHGVKITKYYYCPHHPDYGVPPYRVDCECRKPKTLLYRRAAEELGLDFRTSWAIGDKIRDCIGPMQLGCRGLMLIADPTEAKKMCTAYPGLQTAATWSQAVDIIKFIHI